MIRLHGQMLCPPARRAEVRAALPAHIRLTRAEPGCMAFEVTETETGFAVREAFATRADLAAHQDRVLRSAWGRITAGLPRDYTITEDPATPAD